MAQSTPRGMAVDAEPRCLAPYDLCPSYLRHCLAVEKQCLHHNDALGVAKYRFACKGLRTNISIKILGIEAASIVAHVCRDPLSRYTCRATRVWGTSKQHMKLQQPRNYDFRVSQFDPPRSQSSNDREMTTSPPGHD